jgi:hypothetical protein
MTPTPYRRYYGSYPNRGVTFSCFCAARSFDEANSFFKEWNILASAEGVSDDPVRVPMPGEPGFPHWLVFVSWIALKSGTFNEDILCDSGPIHEAMHLHEGVSTLRDDALDAYITVCKKLHFLVP